MNKQEESAQQILGNYLEHAFMETYDYMTKQNLISNNN